MQGLLKGLTGSRVAPARRRGKMTKIEEIERDIQPLSYLNSFKAIEHIKYLLARLKELEKEENRGPHYLGELYLEGEWEETPDY